VSDTASTRFCVVHNLVCAQNTARTLHSLRRVDVQLPAGDSKMQLSSPQTRRVEAEIYMLHCPRTTLASLGGTVRVIDADPQRTLGRWSEGSSRYKEIVAITQPGRRSNRPHRPAGIAISVRHHRCAGDRKPGNGRCNVRADLVLIPMQAKTADADVATRAIGLLRSKRSSLSAQSGTGSYS